MSEAHGLVAFDLDGTLLRGPTVCELLADELGYTQEMKRFEALSTEADIAEARREMARWYRGVPARRLRAAIEGARWAPGAREGVRLLREHGVEVAIASITWHFAVEWLAQEIEVSHVLGTRLDPSGEMEHVWPRDKARWLQKLAAGLGLPQSRLAAAGDRPSDVDLLSAASLRFYVGSGTPPELPGLVHLPGASIETIAAHVLKVWGARSCAR